MKERGLTDETIKEFRLGFAPNDWESLSMYLQKCGYFEKDIIDAGLAIKRSAESGRVGVYDRFRSRIMFPITDISNQVVGFTARVFEPPSPKSAQVGLAKSGESMAKYVNTPQTLIYDKSRVLYGLSKAKLDIKKSDRCILVEGNMDALMSYQAGVHNVVASSGTALTSTHLRLLQRYTKNLGFCFDTDQAGAMATRRGIGLALAQQFNISILEIKDPECKDPADYVKKYGPKWSEVADSAKPVINYYFDRARSSYNPTSAESKTQIISAVAPFIKRLSANVERAHWVSQLASLLRVPEQAVLADITNSKDDLDQYARESSEEVVKVATASIEKGSPDAINEMLLSVVLKNPSLFVEETHKLESDLLDSRTIAIMRQIADEPQPFDFKTFVARLNSEEALQLEFAYLRSQELWQDFTDDKLKLEFNNLISTVRRRAISVRLTNLQFDVKEAEIAKDNQRLTQLASEFNELARQLTLTNYSYGQVQKNQESTKAKKEESPDQVKVETKTENQTGEVF